jgi:hypothetical protein
MMAPVRVNISEECMGSSILMTYSTSSQCASVASYCYRCSYLANSCHPDDGGDTFLGNIGSYKGHTV